MKKMYRVCAFALAAVLLFAACGKENSDSDKEKNRSTTGATIRYEDYITPVVDRKIKDCIDVEQINALLATYTVSEAGYTTDSRVFYTSEDGLHTIMLTLENMTAEDFDVIATNPAVGWIALPEVGEMVYWNSNQTELIAYQNGYALSMSVQNIANGAMIGMAEIILQNLNG